MNTSALPDRPITILIAALGGEGGGVLADWIVHGQPTFPVPSLAPDRFGAVGRDLDLLNRRAIAAYAGYYRLSGAQQMPLA